MLRELAEATEFGSVAPFFQAIREIEDELCGSSSSPVVA